MAAVYVLEPVGWLCSADWNELKAKEEWMNDRSVGVLPRPFDIDDLYQAEHYVGAVRDHALSLACLREGLIPVQARGYDDLAAETLAQFADTHIRGVESDALRSALAASVVALVGEGATAQLPHAETVAQILAELH